MSSSSSEIPVSVSAGVGEEGQRIEVTLNSKSKSLKQLYHYHFSRPHPHPRPHSREPREAPLLFPTLADLPGLLKSNLGSVVHESQIHHLKSRRHEHEHELNSSLTTLYLLEAKLFSDSKSSFTLLANTASEVRAKLETVALGRIAHAEPLDVLHYMGPGDDKSGDISKSYFHTDVSSVWEKQTITSELNAFITSLRHDKKDTRMADDTDSLLYV